MSFGTRLRARRRANTATVDLTPLIDVTFQLLIFFLLTATFQTTPSFKVKLPKANDKEVAEQNKAVVVSISSEGRYDADGTQMDAAGLERRLCEAKQSGTESVNIRADEATDHKFVVEVMDMAKRCGLERMGILHGG